MCLDIYTLKDSPGNGCRVLAGEGLGSRAPAESSQIIIIIIIIII